MSHAIRRLPVRDLHNRLRQRENFRPEGGGSAALDAANLVVGMDTLGDRLVAGKHGVKVLVCTRRATARVALMCV